MPPAITGALVTAAVLGICALVMFLVFRLRHRSQRRVKSPVATKVEGGDAIDMDCPPPAEACSIHDTDPYHQISPTGSIGGADVAPESPTLLPPPPPPSPMMTHEPGKVQADGAAMQAWDSAGLADELPHELIQRRSTGLTTSSGANASSGHPHAHEGGAASTAVTGPVEIMRVRLRDELDVMHHTEELFMGMYQVLSGFERREGGQGVVQYMRRVRTDEPVAVKFFLSSAAFTAEMQLHDVPCLRSMMPALKAVGDGGQVRSKREFDFPAFMVMERGESLKEWRERVQPELTTVVDVRLNPLPPLSIPYR